ncbi:uncharacterized protein rbm33b isoform X2 [Pygocentrus nattereri]|uniref:uncharacterized protein rbm33b isoform X2 n=1 Tax=Pygocentrus nattereri TaxID=42514 RepID=UPI0018915C67|nr:uncharacterized protein rbm33b isoform X2 [Pygocentrus nattereri]
MDSDVEDDILEDDLLTALKDVWDEELNDDLLRSDEEDVTTRDVPAFEHNNAKKHSEGEGAGLTCLSSIESLCRQEVNILPATDLTSSSDPCGPLKESDFVANEKILGPQEQVFEFEEDVLSAAIPALSGAAVHLKCVHEDRAPQVAEEPRGFTGEQQAGEEPDHGEVLDIQINGPVGDEFQDKPREPMRQQEEDSTTKNGDGGSCGLRFRTERKATATVIRSSSAAGRKRPLTETLELCEEDRPAFWSHVNKLRRRGRGWSGTQVDTQNALRIKTPWKMPQHSQNEAQSTNQSPGSSLILWMGGLQSAGVSPQQVVRTPMDPHRAVPLTSAQSPSNPAVDPSSLQDVGDSSRLLHVQTNQAGILTGFAGQHMFHQQHPTSELDSSPVLHGPVSKGVAARHPECSGDQGRPHCSLQRSLGLPSPTKTRPASQFVPGVTSLLAASSSTTHSALQEKVLSVPRRCGNQRFLPNQNLLLSPPEPLPALFPKPQKSQSCASSVQAPPPVCLRSLSSESQSSPHGQAAPLCCAVIRPRMVQISPKCSRALKNPPVLAQNSSFINAARPTPTPAVQVRPVARAVATGMPGAARQQASARAGVCARTMPERVLAGKSRGQEVKEEPQSPLSLLSKKESEGAERDECWADEDDEDSLCQSKAGQDDGGDGVSAWYRQQLKKQKRLREKLMSHKEKRRHLQAQYKRRQKQGKLHEVLLMGKIHDAAPQQCPQPSQDSKQAQSTQKPTQKTRRRCSLDSESHPNLQLCQQQQHGSALLPPLKYPSKPAHPQTHVAQCSAAAAPVRRAVLWHGQRCFGHDDEGPSRFSGELGEWHERTKKIVMRREVKELPSKLRVAKHVGLEEEEDGMSLRFPAQVNEGSRVVTFTRTTFSPAHTLRQVCPNLRRWTASNKLHDKGFWSARRTCQWSDQHQLHRKV